MQMLWELMLLGEPVVVMAPSPTVSSETVLALVRYGHCVLKSLLPETHKQKLLLGTYKIKRVLNINIFLLMLIGKKKKKTLLGYSVYFMYVLCSLFSAIAPLRYCGDYRPYFTIHDSEFKEYTTRTQAP